MKGVVSKDRLLRYLEATPEQSAAIDRFLLGEAGALASRGESGAPRFSLRKGLRGWQVTFEGKETVLPDEKGVAYVAVLLHRPGERIHASELGSAACGHAVIEGQRNLGLEDRETRRAQAEARRECQALLENANASEAERAEARAELEELEAWARKHLRGTEGSQQKQVRSIRQALRRLLDGLRTSEPVLRSFGEHLECYLWNPSGRAGQGRGLRAEAGVAGTFVYEAPGGVVWEK